MKQATKEIMGDARTIVIDEDTVSLLGEKYLALKYSKNEKEKMVSEIKKLLTL